jgi:hypothetical protein
VRATTHPLRQPRPPRTARGRPDAPPPSYVGASDCCVAARQILRGYVRADASVSLDLLVKSLLTLGVSRREVGRVIAKVA